MNRWQNRFTPDNFGEERDGGPVFQGMRYDQSVPLVDFATRDFSPTLKGWMPDDPCGYVDGLNVYSAPVDHPMLAVDPLGT